MDIVTIVGIAFGLAMDAFSVSISSGITIGRPSVGNALKISTFFGSFQTFMPLVGWTAGLGLLYLISGIDHWIAFGLLCLIGFKMIYESIRKDSDRKANPLNSYVLLMLSIVTSIDALAVGVGLAFLDLANIMFSVVVIGVVTFSLSFSGVFVGRRLSHFLDNRIRFVGGLILILIGTKILVEHIA